MVGEVSEDSPKKNVVIKYDVEAHELLQVSNRHVMEDLQSEEVTFSPKSPIKGVAAPPKVAKVVDKSQTGNPKMKASQSDHMEQGEELKKEEETKKAAKPKQISRYAKKDKGGHSIEFDEGEKDKVEGEEELAAVPIVWNVLEGSQISGLKRKVALDKEEDLKKVKWPKKVLIKSKKTVEDLLGSGKKEEEDKKEQEIAAVSKVVQSKKPNRPKKNFVIKYDVEVPELLQASNRRVMEDSQSEKVTFCPDRATESVAALPKVAKVVGKRQAGKPKKKASSSDLVEQESLDDFGKIKEKCGRSASGDKAEEVGEVAVVPVVEKVLEESQANVLQEGNCLKVMRSKKARRPVKKFVIKYDEEVLSRHRWMPLPLNTQRPGTMKLSTTRFPICNVYNYGCVSSFFEDSARRSSQ
ncbi:hypothetical protein MKX03_007866 [Papaver bracteatum]|nr:hypothetical protein MKX03_007866 [Papaver bracteatum]